MSKLVQFIKSKSNELACCGIFFIASCPLLGNALIYSSQTANSGIFNRRSSQLLFLIAGLILCLPLVLKNYKSAFNTIFHKCKKRKIFYFFCGTLILQILFAVINKINLNQSLTFELCELFILFILWISLLWLFVGTYEPLTIAASPTKLEFFKKYKIFSAVMYLCITFCIFKAWFIGPAPKEVYMAFGGSPIFVGVAESFATFAPLWSLPVWSANILFFLSSYLLVMSTSRTAFIIAFTFFCLLLVRKIFFQKLSLKELLKQVLIPVLIFIFFLFLPLLTQSRFYPYQLSATEGVEKSQFLQDEYALRMSRLLRIFPFVSADPAQGKLKIFGLNVEISKPENKATRVENIVMQQAQTTDYRKTLYQYTFNLIKKRPQGYWPIQYSDVIGMTCGEEKGCTYPHNGLLEITYAFGWLAGLFYFLGLLGIIFCLIECLLKSTSTLLSLSSLAFFSYIILMQLSGNLTDTIPTLALGYIWLFLRNIDPQVA